MNSMTPGPKKDWEMTPESVQELINELAIETIHKTRKYHSQKAQKQEKD